MPKFDLITYEADPYNGGKNYALIMHIGGTKAPPYPPRKVEAKNVAAALALLAQYRDEAAEAVTTPAVVTMDLARNERAPAGWRKLDRAERHLKLNF